jgi:hypothetical protein
MKLPLYIGGGVDFMEQSPSAKLQLIVGDIGYDFNNDIGKFYDFIGKMYTLLTTSM